MLPENDREILNLIFQFLNSLFTVYNIFSERWSSSGTSLISNKQLFGHYLKAYYTKFVYVWVNLSQLLFWRSSRHVVLTFWGSSQTNQSIARWKVNIRGRYNKELIGRWTWKQMRVIKGMFRQDAPSSHTSASFAIVGTYKLVGY